ncbi:Uncharacterized protein TCM_043769 [Theobroma cacao]|uniref:Uncharacterized protein n=1 Tax=Theobroma cacao TaxID=3641 RepID=A0A061FW90_THECC|nr:Uncharacterized protein TCM_043769 [Theobroma cacao]
MLNLTSGLFPKLGSSSNGLQMAFGSLGFSMGIELSNVDVDLIPQSLNYFPLSFSRIEPLSVKVDFPSL